VTSSAFLNLDQIGRRGDDIQKVNLSAKRERLELRSG
jgi:hypothetical protein